MTAAAIAELEARRQRFEAALPAGYENAYKLRKLRYPKLQVFLERLSRQAAMAGVEPRSPMFARKFIEFSASTPEHLRRRGGETKRIHRQAMAGLLPPQVLGRTSKAEFRLVFDRHLERIRQDILIQPPAELSPWFDPARLQALGQQCCTATLDGRTMWRLWEIYLVTALVTAQRPIRSGDGTVELR